MHYIIGTAFRIPTQQEQQVRPQGIVSSVGQGSTVANVAREWVDFEPGHTYTLYNIQKVDEGVQYVFSSQTGAQQVVKVFESASDGDNVGFEQWPTSNFVGTNSCSLEVTKSNSTDTGGQHIRIFIPAEAATGLG